MAEILVSRSCARRPTWRPGFCFFPRPRPPPHRTARDGQGLTPAITLPITPAITPGIKPRIQSPERKNARGRALVCRRSTEMKIHRLARSRQTRPGNFPVFYRETKSWAASGVHNPDVSTRPDVRLFPLFCAFFFPCSPLFLRRRLFSRRRKGLHCNWRAFSPVDRLYFSWHPQKGDRSPYAARRRNVRGRRRAASGDCFAEFILGLAEGETRGLAMTRRRYRPLASPSPSSTPSSSLSTAGTA